jgi:hypothetical protein
MVLRRANSLFRKYATHHDVRHVCIYRPIPQSATKPCDGQAHRGMSVRLHATHKWSNSQQTMTHDDIEHYYGGKQALETNFRLKFCQRALHWLDSANYRSG